MTTILPGSTLLTTEDIVARAALVAPLHSFPTVDDLAARFAAIEQSHPDLVSSTRVATSRLGEPILSYTVGSGSRTHLVVGGVHPNEPIGSWTAIHLAESLIADPGLRDALDATWHIVPNIDPDGARLNEGWFGAPGDRAFYARRFYRPAPDQQVEWTFPLDHRGAYFDQVMPETFGLMRLIDELKPDLYVALHNGEMGGVYYYLSRAVPELYDVLHAIPARLGLPLQTGEAESPMLRELAPAIFATVTVAEAYDYLENLGMDPTSMEGGSSSSEYADRHGTLSLVAELPYWSHPDADDQTPSGESYAHLLHRTAAVMRESGEQLARVLSAAVGQLTLDTPFLHASKAFVPMLCTQADADDARATARTANRPATIAERFGLEDFVTCFRLRYGGMLLRALEAEISAGVATAAVHRIATGFAGVYAGWQREAADADRAEVIPIERLVGVQYGAILAAAAHLAGTAPTAVGDRLVGTHG